MIDWQKIDTVPKMHEGPDFLVWCSGVAFIAYWLDHDEGGYIAGDAGYPLHGKITHWAPINAPGDAEDGK